MKIAVITGTEVKGCTYNIKEAFLEPLREGNEITEFYLPRDLPRFCCGCKTCFLKSEEKCPNAEYVRPIWKAMMDADLIVFASPVYALRVTGQLKTLLDHLCVHWLVHRPEENMFSKKAVILTNAIGVFNGGAQRDLTTSLSWLGVSDIKKLGVGLLEGVIWNELSEKRRKIIIDKTKRLSARYKREYRARMGLVVWAKFSIMKVMHKAIAKKEDPLSADNRHWIAKGWIKLK